MNDLLFTILKLILIAICSLITIGIMHLNRFLKQKMNNEDYQEIYKLVETAVRGAEQTIVGEGMGPIKKDTVLSNLHAWLKDRGLPINEGYLDQLIEEFVYLMNKDKE